jgi:hypothetical protein
LPLMIRLAMQGSYGLTSNPMDSISFWISCNRVVMIVACHKWLWASWHIGPCPCLRTPQSLIHFGFETTKTL